MAAVEDDSEKDKGTDSEELEDKDENYAPKKRPVSPYVLIRRDASIMIFDETRSDQCKEKYYGLFARSIWWRMMQVVLYYSLYYYNPLSGLVPIIYLRKYSYVNILNSRSNL